VCLANKTAILFRLDGRRPAILVGIPAGDWTRANTRITSALRHTDLTRLYKEFFDVLMHQTIWPLQHVFEASSATAPVHLRLSEVSPTLTGHSCDLFDTHSIHAFSPFFVNYCDNDHYRFSSPQLDASTLEAHKSLVRDFFPHFCDKKDFSNPERFLSPSFTSHRADRTIVGREAWVGGFSHALTAFMPNFKAELKREIAEGNYVWTFAHITGLPEKACPAGMHKLSVDMFRFDKDGKLAEHWDVQQNVDSKVADF
jgi:predicted SnoaL-like aldol condensation-catalyzing enzyme